MTPKVYRLIVAILAIAIGLYPSTYLFVHQKFGLLLSKSDTTLHNVFWNIGFYTHISSGALALLIGWMQFNPRLRENRLMLHRNVGKVYIIAACLSALAAVYIALYANGGIIASLGFISLGVIWFYTTLRAYFAIRNLQIIEHQKMMTYSYAACFAAVTLRIYLPLLTMLFNDFIKAYLIVAWLCWIPNMIVAYFLTRRLKTNRG
ncbi:MAG: DUF2306 domain-containing protein [Sediminibacterium magnilacihabitans]|jgi:uncharacterized membrane protein|nr:DUF2306 domain-containing protein [Sediminibacterium magnilacihabitans]PQV61234.1 putative membrane protein [Sediminibacterium magnilacihabitans]